MKSRYLLSAFVLSANFFPSIGQAHNMWINPSQTQLSGEKAWTTFGVGASTIPFVADHAGLDTNNFTVTSPTGEAVDKQNAQKGNVRSVFDVELTEPGTYRIHSMRVGFFGRYEKNGERKRWRGSIDDVIKGNYPKEMDVNKARFFVGQIETFVTLNGVTEDVVKPSVYGLDVEYLTHPNELYTDEPSKFRALIDGKPAKGVEVTLIKKGAQYQDTNKKVVSKIGEDGTFEIKWTEPGVYWLGLSAEDNNSVIANGKRRLVYSSALEVLPE